MQAPVDRKPAALPRCIGVILYCLLSAVAPSTHAQAAPPKPGTFDATTLREPTDLGGTWLVKGGDDLAYARPDFDDSGWTPFDPSKDIRPLFPHGNPGIIWYRLHVKVAPDDTGLTLAESSISHAFSVYANGIKLIELGTIDPYVSYYPAATIFARIPDNQIATGSVVIALRVHNDRGEWAMAQPGYYPTNLRLGQNTALHHDFWLTLIGNNSLEWVGSFTVSIPQRCRTRFVSSPARPPGISVALPRGTQRSPARPTGPLRQFLYLPDAMDNNLGTTLGHAALVRSNDVSELRAPAVRVGA